MSWPQVLFDTLIEHSAFGPRFSGACYSDVGNVATLRTTDISADGIISLDTMPEATIEENKFAGHFLRVGDLVISRSGRIGTTAIFNGYRKPVLPGAFLIRFRLNKNKVDPLFYRYFFNSKEGQELLHSVARGAAQQNINITNVRRLPVPLPPLDKQSSIAETLSDFDDLIENNRRRIQLLEESAHLLYQEWFVYLRFPGHEQIRITDGVPEGWAKKPLKQIAKLNYGKALKAELRVPGSYPVYGSSGEVGTHEKALCKGPGIVIGRKGNVGSVFWLDRDFYPIDTVYFINREESNLFLYHALQNVQFINTDVAVPGLNRDMAYSREILIPANSILEQFLDEANPIHAQIFKLQEYNEKLAQARDLLLPKLMSGELAV